MPIVYELGAPGYSTLDSFLRCRSAVSVIIGPLGSGKTFTAVQRLLLQMSEQPPNARGERPTRWLAIRNTRPDLETTTIKDFQAVLGDLGSVTMGAPPTWRARMELPDGTAAIAEVIFIGLDGQDDVRKLRGQQVTGIWLNEVRELDRAIVDMADGRHGRYPSVVDGGVACGWHGMLGDTNAFDTDHWLYPFVEAPPQGWVFFRQPPGVLRQNEEWHENPAAENLGNLAPGYYARMLGGKTEDWIRVNLGNEFVYSTDGKPVHPEYVDAVHCVAQPAHPSPGAALLLGVDFGRTPAAVFLLPQLGGARHIAIDELVSVDESAALFGPRLKAYLDREYAGCLVEAYGDPAGDHQGQSVEETPIQILRAQGIPIQAAPTNEPILRRAAVANPLTRLCVDGRPALLVAPQARITRRGLQGGFRYRRVQVSGTQRYTDVPDKNEYSHPCEALEYALLGAGEGRAALRPPEHHWRMRLELPSHADM